MLTAAAAAAVCLQGETRPSLPTTHRLPLLAFAAKEVRAAASSSLCPHARVDFDLRHAAVLFWLPYSERHLLHKLGRITVGQMQQRMQL